MRQLLTARNGRYFLAAAASFVAIIFSANIFRQEAAALTYGGTNNIAFHNRIHAGSIQPAFSTYANKRILLTCLNGMAGLRAQVNTPKYNIDYAGQCRTIVDGILETNPTDSFAWTIRAYASATLQDYEGMNHDLVMSWRTGPNEQWIARHRVDLEEKNVSNLSADARKINANDLKILILSQGGVLSIAKRYWSDDAFKKRITDIVETMPEKYQRRFVNWVRKAANET
ncbi:hypothetical protein [Rhizobium sp. L1K21]|uniref:hypothetical protein n=1 Tax=Rhizobium sp. L1K21 TaxID=2954933 RepID=UPI002093DF21|nr:hypothetical protein [Rhizobium sp. L1K21]MCO6187474.1 hypothetical protein [Rhizobium sp. L1K21]